MSRWRDKYIGNAGSALRDYHTEAYLRTMISGFAAGISVRNLRNDMAIGARIHWSDYVTNFLVNLAVRIPLSWSNATSTWMPMEGRDGSC